MDDEGLAPPLGEPQQGDTGEAAEDTQEPASSSEAAKPKRKARKKKLVPKSMDGSSGWMKELPPEVAIPHVVDFEGLLAVLSSRHAELDSKLEGWMQRQEALLQDISAKLLQSGPPLPAPVPVAAVAARPAKTSMQSVGRSPTLKNFAEKVLKNVDQPLESDRSSARSAKAVNFTAVAEAINEVEDLGEVGREDTGAVKDLQAIASVDKAISGQTAKSKKSHKRMRTSREVQAAYLERMKREMAKTRKMRGSRNDHTCKGKIAFFLGTPAFEIIMMVLSVTCAVVVGVEVNWFSENIGATSPPVELLILNHVLSMFFAMELAMKVYVYQCDFFRIDLGWHCLDILIVSTGLAELIIDVANYASTSCNDCPDAEESGIDLSVLRAVRIGRAVRLARLARLVQYIRELRRLILSVAGTLKAVFWAMILLALFIYSFAVVFQQAVNDWEHGLITKNETVVPVPSSTAAVDRYFDGLARTAMTLLQTATGGVSWIEVEATLAGISPLLVLVFLMYFSFIYFAILNVVTGVFCSSAIESASEDAGMLVVDHMRKCEEYTSKLTTLFKQIDSDQSETISILEFEENFGDPEVRALFNTLGIDEDKAWKLFEILDENEDGEIHVEEFVSRCFKLRGAAQRLDTERIYAVMKRQSAQLDDISGYVHDLLRGITSLVINQHKRNGTLGRSQTNWGAGS